jgi:hypothetical protein
MKTIPNDLLLFDYKDLSLVNDDIEKIAALIQPNPSIDPDDEDGVIWYSSKNLIRMYWKDEDGENFHCVYSFSDELVSYLSDISSQSGGGYNTAITRGDDAQQWRDFLQLARDLIGDRVEGMASMEYCSPDICIHKDEQGVWSWSS